MDSFESVPNSKLFIQFICSGNNRHQTKTGIRTSSSLWLVFASQSSVHSSKIFRAGGSAKVITNNYNISFPILHLLQNKAPTVTPGGNEDCRTRTPCRAFLSFPSSSSSSCYLPYRIANTISYSLISCTILTVDSIGKYS